MTNAIHRFTVAFAKDKTLEDQGELMCMMPAELQVVDVQPGSKGLNIWAIVDPAAEAEPTSIKVVKTGEPFDPTAQQHLFTRGGFHLFRAKL